MGRISANVFGLFADTLDDKYLKIVRYSDRELSFL